MKIIAEIGSNHLGSFDLAMEHIKMASEVGADGVKFQLFRAERLDSREEVRERLKPFELPVNWLQELKEEANLAGMSFIVTPFDLISAACLSGKVDAVKISAYDLTYTKLVREAAMLRVPIILSTAMASMWEVHKAVMDIRAVWPRGDLTLLHGVAAYPAESMAYDMNTLPLLRSAFGWADPAIKVGISDHTLNHAVPIVAAALGANMLERHFILEKLPGESPDSAVSSTPRSFRAMVDSIRNIEAMTANHGYKLGPLPVEMPLFKTCRRTDEKELRG